MREKFSIRLISINEIPEVTNWARLEGFSPGMDDVSIYRNTDKQGVWVACLDKQPIGLFWRQATHNPCLSVFL